MKDTIMDDSTTLSNTKSPKPRKRRIYWIVGIVMFALTIAIFYAVENWRGARAWNEFKLQFEAKGKSLDWNDYIPPVVPDEENAFKAPQMRPFIRVAGETGPESRASESLFGVSNLPIPVTPKELLIARVVAASPTPATANPSPIHSQSSSLSQAATDIQEQASSRTQGASGPRLISKSLAEAEPLQINLPYQKDLTAEDLSVLLPDFSVRLSTNNVFEITLSETISAEEYLSSTPSLQGAWAPLVAALQRPYARIDGDYQLPYDLPLPNFVDIRTVAQTLTQQAQSFLLLGKSKEALDYLSLVHNMRALLEPPPAGNFITLVSAMINVAINGLYVAVIQDGLRLQAWSDTELQALAKQLESIHLLPLVNQALNTELVAFTHSAQVVPLSELLTLGVPKKWALLLPRGWTYQNMVTYARIMETQIASVEDPLPLVSPQKLDQAVEELEALFERSSPYTYLARIAVPNMGKSVQTAARVQTEVHQAQIACALERYRLAHGEYPVNLEALLPNFLAKIPYDVIDGNAMRYQRISPGGFTLYSIGWNEKDDSGKTGDDLLQGGDLVWNKD